MLSEKAIHWVLTELKKKYPATWAALQTETYTQAEAWRWCQDKVDYSEFQQLCAAGGFKFAR